MIYQLRSKNTGHGSPLYYFYMNENEYPDIVGNKIATENVTLFLQEFFSKKKIINLIKNKDFKRADLVYFPRPNMYGVSFKFRKYFEGKIKAEFFETTIEGYYLMIVNNIVDCIDKNKSTITYVYPARRFTYKRPSEFIIDEKKLEDELLFSLPEEPLKTFCTEEFIRLCKEGNIKNVLFENF